MITIKEKFVALINDLTEGDVEDIVVFSAFSIRQEGKRCGIEHPCARRRLLDLANKIEECWTGND